MGAKWPQGPGQFEPQGLDWYGRIYVGTKHSYILNLLAFGFMDSEKIFEGSLAVLLYLNIWSSGCGQFGA